MSAWTDWIDGKSGGEFRADGIKRSAAPIPSQRKGYTVATLYGEIIGEANGFSRSRAACQEVIDDKAALQARIVELEAQLVSEREAAEKRLYEENDRGGVARETVRDIGYVLGVNLMESPVGGKTWSPENMRRVLQAISKMQVSHRRAANLIAGAAQELRAS